MLTERRSPSQVPQTYSQAEMVEEVPQTYSQPVVIEGVPQTYSQCDLKRLVPVLSVHVFPKKLNVTALLYK